MRTRLSFLRTVWGLAGIAAYYAASPVNRARVYNLAQIFAQNLITLSHHPRTILRVKEDLMSLVEHQTAHRIKRDVTPHRRRDIVRDAVANVLMERGIAAPFTASQVILDCLIRAPEAVKLDLIHRLMGGRQCLVCGDLIDP